MLEEGLMVVPDNLRGWGTSDQTVGQEYRVPAIGASWARPNPHLIHLVYLNPFTWGSHVFITMVWWIHPDTSKGLSYWMLVDSIVGSTSEGTGLTHTVHTDAPQGLQCDQLCQAFLYHIHRASHHQLYQVFPTLLCFSFGLFCLSFFPHE